MNSKVKTLMVMAMVLVVGCDGTPSVSGAQSYRDKLCELVELREAGVISDIEYRFKKRKVIRSMLL